MLNMSTEDNRKNESHTFGNTLLYAVYDSGDETVITGGFLTRVDAESRMEELEEDLGKGAFYVDVQNDA